MTSSESTQSAREKVCKLAYEESIKGLSVQDSTLSSVRQNAAMLGTLAGLAATFLGKEVLTRSNLMPCTDASCLVAPWVAMGALGFSMYFIVLILRPRDGWIFHSSASSILDQFAKQGNVVPFDQTYDALARFNEDNYNNNDTILKELFTLLRVLVAAIVVQTIAWLVALI